MLYLLVLSLLSFSFFLFFFFFSSRRRHTRCLSDWSSDVCSSDLSAAAVSRLARQVRAGVERTHGSDGRLPQRPTTKGEPRSEERRVGKECRARWSAEH